MTDESAISGSGLHRCDGGSVQEGDDERGSRYKYDTDRCYNPLCEEELTCDPGDKEGYCCWECAVMARSGTANRILHEQREAGLP